MPETMRPQTDAGKLKHAITVLLESEASTYNDCQVTHALAYAGVLGCNNGSIILSEADIGTLTVPGINAIDAHLPLPTYIITYSSVTTNAL